MKRIFILLTVTLVIGCATQHQGDTYTSDKSESTVLAIKEQGFFTVGGFGVPKEQFLTLTKRPIVIYFGDNIPDFDKTAELPAQNFWSGVRELAYKFAEVINANGGDCTVVDLPKVGITGNTHFMFQDLNNQEVFEHIYK